MYYLVKCFEGPEAILFCVREAAKLFWLPSSIVEQSSPDLASGVVRSQGALPKTASSGIGPSRKFISNGLIQPCLWDFYYQPNEFF